MSPASPSTCTGVALSVVVPLPSCPTLLRPQHRTELATTAHPNSVPLVMAVAPLPSPFTCTGVLLLVVVPSPNCP
jgi:hypothetical protein